MTVTVRKVEVKDVDQIHTLGMSAQEFSVGVWEGFWTKDQLSNWAQSKTDLTLVAVNEDEEVLGFSLYAVHTPTGKVTWENLFVSKDHQRQGIAKSLALEGLQQLKDMGYNYVALQNHNVDQDKFASYLERFGFKRGDTVMWMDRFIKPHTDAEGQ